MIVMPPTTVVPGAVNYVPKADPRSDSSLLVETDDVFKPPFVRRLEDLEVPMTFLTDLALKTMSLDPACTSADIAARMHLGLMLSDEILQRLNRDKFIEINGVVGTADSQSFSIMTENNRRDYIARSLDQFTALAGFDIGQPCFAYASRIASGNRQ